MLQRDQVEAEGFGERVHGAGGAVHVELLLEQRVDGAVQVERVARRPPDAEAAVQVETARALQEQVDLAPAEPEGFGGVRREEVTGAARVVVLGHTNFIN